MPGLHSATTVRLQRRHVGFTHLSRKRFFASRVKHSSHSTSTFQITRIVLSGDVSMNPGPPKCSVCDKTIARNNRAVECNACHRRLHIKCGKVKATEIDRIRAQSVKTWTCPCCLDQLKQLPFANTSNFDTSGRFSDTSDTEDDSLFDPWSSFDTLAKKHRANTKIGHINANSIAGFKFHDIRNWLLSGRFDILLITETKIDASFSNGQFNVDGFRMHRVDRDIHGGGLMIFIRSDICFHVITRFNIDLSSFRTEFMMFKVKINRSWFALAGIYKPPNILKSQWKFELSSIFDAATTISNDVILLGDFNCDMIEPNKPPMDGRDLCDLLDIYNLENLIKSPTRITKTSKTLLDLILTNNKKRVLSSGVVDVQISDHFLVFTILRLSAPRLQSRKIYARGYKNFNSDTFLDDLQNAPFHIMDVFDDVDDKLFAFESLYLDIINEQAPIKKFHARGNQVPFMSEQWRKSIRHRNKLWKKFTHDRTDANYALYRKQRNKCTFLRRKAIKAYFLNKSETEKSNDFWNTYRPFLQSKKSRQANDILLEENGGLIKDETEIANIFNSYFIHIADAATEINEEDFGSDCSTHPSIQSILSNHSSNIITNFDFEFINSKQVEKFLLELNTRKSCGHDLIPPRLLKESASVISEPLAKIINCSISLGHYPSRWKMGQVTPLFEKDAG